MEKKTYIGQLQCKDILYEAHYALSMNKISSIVRLKQYCGIIAAAIGVEEM